MNKKINRDQVEAQAEQLAQWAESDDFLESMKAVRVTEKNDDDSQKTQQLMAALKRGRPALSTEPQGASPTIQFRVPENLRELLVQRSRLEHKSQSQIAREALSEYLTTTDSVG